MQTLRTHQVLYVLIVGMLPSITPVRADDPVPLPRQIKATISRPQKPPQDSTGDSATKPESPPPKTAKPTPKRPVFSEQQIAQLIEDLGSEKFTVRSTASATLEKVGKAAVGPLTIAMETDDTEVRLRAFKCLESYFSGDDIETVKATWPVLEKLKRSADNKHVAERSHALLIRYGGRREELFFERFVEFNGIVQRLDNPPRVMVAVDSDWKGGDDGMSLLRILGDAGLSSNCAVYLIDGAPVSKKTVAEIETLLTSKQVVFQTRGKASLGISHALNFRGLPGCVVGDAIVGKSAAEAGIRENDVIVRFGGKDVEDFAQLVDLIRTYEVGAKVKVDLMGSRSVTVTLQSWRATVVDPAKQVKPKLRLGQ